MSVSLQGFHDHYATMKLAADAPVGSVVEITADTAVSPAVAGKPFAGVLVSKHGDNALVQLTGYCKVGYTGALSYGRTHVAAAAGGKISPKADGMAVLVADIDITAGVAGIIL